MSARRPMAAAAGPLPITVVMPTMRADRHLDTAVRSVLRDDVDELELVVVLDGLDPRDVHLPRHDRLRVVALPERRGTPAALNAGAHAGTGPLIARLDADDVALPGRFEAQRTELARRPDLVCLGSSVSLIDDDDAPLGDWPAATGPGLAETLLRRNVFVHSSTVYRREAFEAVGGYDERCTRMQDYELWLRLATIGGLDSLPDVLTAYRVHPGQHSRNTPPWGAPARRVRASRLALARHLGRPTPVQHVENAAWSAAQALRHAGLRRPGYLRA